MKSILSQIYMFLLINKVEVVYPLCGYKQNRNQLSQRPRRKLPEHLSKQGRILKMSSKSVSTRKRKVLRLTKTMSCMGSISFPATSAGWLGEKELPKGFKSITRKFTFAGELLIKSVST